MDNAHQTGSALASITVRFEAVTQRVRAIADASETQDHAVRGVSGDLAGIDSLSQKTLDNTMRGVEMANALTDLSNDLDSRVKTFKLA
jgi:methyl-accepting chemotaxis protein